MRAISHFILKKINQIEFFAGGSSDYKKPSLNTLKSTYFVSVFRTDNFSALYFSLTLNDTKDE